MNAKKRIDATWYDYYTNFFIPITNFPQYGNRCRSGCSTEESVNDARNDTLICIRTGDEGLFLRALVFSVNYADELLSCDLPARLARSGRGVGQVGARVLAKTSSNLIITVNGAYRIRRNFYRLYTGGCTEKQKKKKLNPITRACRRMCLIRSKK